MAYRIEFADRAARDLEALYVEKNAAESQAASRWYNDMEEAVSALAVYPHRRPAAPEGRTRDAARHVYEHSLLRKELHVACTEHPSVIGQPHILASLFPKLPRCLACMLPNFQCIRSRVRQYKLARWHLAIGGGRIQH